MSKHSKHHDSKNHVEKVNHSQKQDGGSKNLLLIAGATLIIGLIIGAVLAFSAGYALGVSGSNPSTIDEVKLKADIESYVNANLINDESVLAKISDINNLGNNLYEMEYEIYQDEELVGSGFFYSVGSELIIGQRFDLTKPIEQTPVEEEEQVQTQMTKSDIPKVNLYIMSFCPFGLQAVGAFMPAIQLLEKNIDFNLSYVIYSDYASNYGQDWSAYCFDEEEKYCSMHGIEELNENIRELCIQKYQKDKLWDYMSLLVDDYTAGKVSTRNISTMWKEYATTAKVDIAAVEKCFNEEAETLLAEQVTLNAKYGVQGSPTAIINDAKYSGARTADAFKTTICSAFNTAPSECEGTLDSTATAAAGSC
ncbi:MAG TPA: thioredoxin domain-containing protein [archaeon]|nr:thioredoxin domain-containing protein [archaeon]